MKPVKRETNRPPQNLPYRDINQPFRFQFVIPGNGIMIEQDANGICYISTSGVSPDELVAGDNIEITRKDGKVVISAVDSVTDIAAGQNVTIDIDPETGTAIINSIIGGADNEHYKGVFDTAQDLIAYDTDPELGDYGLVKNVTYSDGGEVTWNGQYKYCFYINGQWTVVDQMLTFTKNRNLLQQFYSVGGSSPVIYLHEIARTGNFEDLDHVARVATPEVTVSGDTVTVTCETEGAEIWYSTDGSMPHVNGTKYTGPITAADATSFRFVGIKNGMINSFEAVADADFSLQPPTIELDYLLSKITLGNPNVDGGDNPVGSVYYTIDGSEPTSASTLYTGEFVLPTFQGSNPRIVKAVVYDSVSGKYSPVASESYQYLFVNGTEYLNVETGRYNLYWYSVLLNNQRVADANTYYTTDGSDPDYNSDEMTAAIHAQLYGNPTTLKLKAYAPGKLPSAVRTLTYGYAKPTAPTISFDSSDNMVTLGATGTVTQYRIPLKTDNASPETGYRIYYTLDGSTPTAASTIYTGPFQITGNVNVKAVIVAFGQYSSDVTEREIGVMTPPSATLDWHTGAVTMVNPNAGGEIHYTLDGSTPTAASALYTEPVVLTGPVTVKMIVVNNGATSAVTTETYDQAGTVELSYSTTNPQTGMFSIYARGSRYDEIRYAIDSLTPPAYDTSTPYTSPIVRNIFDTQAVYSFRIFREGLIPGATESVTLGDTPDAPSISYNEDTGIVTLALDGNTADIQLQTNNNVPELGARIYYTLDGSTPVPGTSAMYTSPFALPEGVSVIKAVTNCFGHFDSEVTTENVSPAPTVDYLTFTAEEPGSTISMVSTLATAPNLEISTDGGQTWQEWQHENAGSTHTFSTITLGSVGDAVKMRGSNPNGFLDLNNQALSHFSLTGKIAASGSVQSIVDGNPLSNTAVTMPFFSDYLFNQISTNVLTSAPDLPATELVDYCYIYMFAGCTGLTSAPDLPATVPVGRCYQMMFAACSFNMSDDGSNFNFAFGAELPLTIAGFTFDTYFEIAEFMGNINGFDVYINIETNNATYGSASGGGLHPIGSQVQISASANDGYYFMEWSDGNTDAQRTITVTQPMTLTAYFEIMPVLTLNSNEATYGSVSGGGAYAPGTQVQISASANNGYVFGDWSDGNTDAQRTIIVNSDTELTAYFVPITEYLSFFASSPSTINLDRINTDNGFVLEYSLNGEDWSVWEENNNSRSLSLNSGERVYLRTTSEVTSSNGAGMNQLNNYRFSFSNNIQATGNIASILHRSFYRAVFPSLTVNLGGLFKNCQNLTSAPTMPYSSLYPRQMCKSMFEGCTGLTSAPALTATVLYESCYESMFEGCIGLTSAPDLPATTTTQLEYKCYYRMFAGCISLSIAPDLPSTLLAPYCYASMFEGCTGLTSAPALPTTTITNSGFYNAIYCYSRMFAGCTSLTSAPTLPATVLSDFCYREMFYDCAALSSIICLAPSISTSHTGGWTHGVAALGIFTKDQNSIWSSGDDGIPTGWTVQDYQP